MAEKPTLAKMADAYGVCQKTFKRYVREYRIPHEKLGREMYFDPDEVRAHLRRVADERAAAPAAVPDPRAKKTARRSSRSGRSAGKARSKYAEMLGL